MHLPRRIPMTLPRSKTEAKARLVEVATEAVALSDRIDSQVPKPRREHWWAFWRPPVPPDPSARLVTYEQMHRMQDLEREARRIRAWLVEHEDDASDTPGA